jgi:hypothetical protein
VTCTRLPTAAKHNAIGMMASAPATSASGAAAPICVASADGMRKMPPPTITLITAAVNANEPTARSKAASPCNGAGGVGRVASFIGEACMGSVQVRTPWRALSKYGWCRCGHHPS